jgi:hypothetical protein
MAAQKHRYKVIPQEGGSFGVEVANAHGTFSSVTGFATESAARAWVSEQVERDRAVQKEGDDS